MIHETFQKAAAFHGHVCPGLAIGVRAAAEALKILGAERGAKGLSCIAESRACYIDGIQWVFGVTPGNGNLEIRKRGKTAFNFYSRNTGTDVRLLARDWPQGLEKAEMIEFLLTAPLEQVFDLTETRFAPPPDSFTRRPSVKCARCGEACREPFLRIVQGETVCLDCAERG